MEQAIFQERLSYYRAPGPGVATLIAGPTILQFGSEETKREWLPRIAKAEVRFWLAYSEPNAGSDLAAIQTSAVEDGEYLIVNGQKSWSSGAHVSDYAWMLVRTNPSAPAHKGISLVILDNRSPGISIRPLINICGFHSFNEVFFDNVRVPKRNIVGQRDRGWYYAMAALDYERLVVPIGNFKRTLEELVQWVKKEGLSQDILVKDRLAELAIEIQIAYMFFWQTACMLDKGLLPNIEASVFKLVAAELSRKLAHTAVTVMGHHGELHPDVQWAPFRGRACIGYLDCISALVGAGSSEIQRNIIAARGLGLPWA
jgi:alkylation response protein AidB-like acyl-CoA dehydrogenase